MMGKPVLYMGGRQGGCWGRKGVCCCWRMLQQLLACVCLAVLLLQLVTPIFVSGVSLRAYTRPPRLARVEQQRDWLREVLEQQGYIQTASEWPSMWPQPGSRSPTTYHRLMLPPNSVPFRLKTFSSSVSPLLKQPEVVVEHFRDPLVASTTSSRSPPSPPYHRREHSADGAAADAAEKENEQSAVSDSKDDGISAGESEKYERLTDLWRPEPFDLISTGYTRGHLAARQHHFEDPGVDLLFTNISPQSQPLNSHNWNAIENIVNASKRYFSDVLVYTGPVWFPVDASSSLPLVYGHSQPQEEDAESGARKIYACVRPWEGATVGLPVSVEALDGSPFVPPLGRRFLKEFPGKEQQRKETEDSPWILMPSPLKEALERCRWRLSPAVEKPGLSPALRIEYEVFGFQLTPVPTHFFKLILAVNPKVHPSGRIRIPGPPKRFYYPPFLAPPAAVGAFLLPNTAIFDRTRPIDFRVPLAFLEYVTGIDFTVVTDVIAGAEANSPYHLGPSKIPQVSPTYLPGGSPSAPFHQEEGPLFDRETALLRYDICSVIDPRYIEEIPTHPGRRRRSLCGFE